MGILQRLLLKVQRLNIRLPRMLRTPLRRFLTKFTGGKAADLIEDWSKPLIACRDRVQHPDLRATTEPAAEPTCGASSHGPVEAQLSSKTGTSAAGPLCLLVTSSLDVGGMEEVVVFLARRLPQHGIRTAVLHASVKGGLNGVPTGRLGKLLLSSGVETVELDNIAGARWLEVRRPDVISAHDVPSWVLATATSLAIPYVDTLHGMHSLFERDPAVEAIRGGRLSRIVAVSDLQRKQYLDLNPSFSPARIITIPNAVDDLRRPSLDREQARAKWGIDDQYVFVSLARHCLQKNTYGLVAAFGDVASRHPEAHLIIAGRPDDPVYFKQVACLRAGLPCRDRIHLRSHNPNPSELLALADGFVLDSFFEGWSLASMEALYAGIPVVLSEVGGACEQVGTTGNRGYVVTNPLGDPLRVNWETIREGRYARQVNREEVVEAMSALITSRKSRLAAKQSLIDESVERFNPQVCLSRHAQVLAAAADESTMKCQKHKKHSLSENSSYLVPR
jgi:glycosyltransferase involved in cell wall biosynthesis